MPHQRKPKTQPPPNLTEEKILLWADEFHALAGKWPTQLAVRRAYPGAPAQRWGAIDLALRRGYRGLYGGSSLARLLAARRGHRNEKALPNFTVQKILKWCDEFHKRTKTWPHHDSSPHKPIPGSSGDTWNAVDSALRSGRRGLPGGSSLARVLSDHRGVPNPADRPQLTVNQILAWADACHQRTGRWPTRSDTRDVIPGSQGDTWGSVFTALAVGLRGLSGGTTFAELLAEHRGMRNVGDLPRLTVKKILSWADAFHNETGRWPNKMCVSQEVPGTSGERWQNIAHALEVGTRGLPGGSSLAQLLAKHRGVRNPRQLPRLTIKQILAWADEYRSRTGAWPTKHGSPRIIAGTHGESWSILDNALRKGRRGLRGHSSLARLLARHRGVPRTRSV